MHGTYATDAARRLEETIKVEIGEAGGPLKRAIGMQPPGRDCFIQVARVSESKGFAKIAAGSNVYSALDKLTRGVS